MNENTVLMYEDNIRICLLSGLKIPSSNVKTGNQLQTYIILKNASPLDAVKSGDDVLICGDCIHRGNVATKYIDQIDVESNDSIECVNTTHGVNCVNCNLCNGTHKAPNAKSIWIKSHGASKNGQRSCYVNVGQAPQGLFRSYKIGNIAPYDKDIHNRYIEGRNVRFGAYGDPAFIPLTVWRNLAHLASNITGYTHQWRHELKQAYKLYCMASCDNKLDVIDAKRLGWRVFEVRP